MKLLDTLKISLLNIKSNKFKSRIFIIVFGIFFILLSLIFSVNKTLNMFIDRYINADFHYKLIAVKVDNEDRNEIIKKIDNLNIKEISKIYPSNIDLFKDVEITNDSDIKGFIELYGNYKGIKYTIDSGRNIENSNEIICASKFFPGNFYDISESDMYDMKSKLNNEFNINYKQFLITNDNKAKVLNEFNKKFKLVGTFDVEEDLTGYNVCYVDGNTFSQMLSESKYKYEDKEKEKNDLKDLEVLVLVDNYANKSNVMNFLKQNNYNCRSYYEMDLDFMILAAKIVKYVIIIILIATIIISYLFINNNIKENENNLKLYKLIGYKYNDIRKIFTFQFELLSLIAFILNIVIVFIIKYIAIILMKSNPELSLLKIYLSYKESFYFLIYLMILIELIFVIYFMIKSKLKRKIKNATY